MPEAAIKSSQGDIAKAVPRLFVLELSSGLTRSDIQSACGMHPER